MNTETKNELLTIFYRANQDFLMMDESNILRDVSERSLCSSLACKIGNQIRNTRFSEYYADVEYNRNGDKIKAILENGPNGEVVIATVVCDLILHSRGEKNKDNLIAVEMKKSGRPEIEIENDSNRLKALTNERANNYSYGSDLNVATVSDFEIGILYIIDKDNKTVEIRIFAGGKEFSRECNSFDYYKHFNH